MTGTELDRLTVGSRGWRPWRELRYARGAASGLVFDVRGTKARPAMAPRILAATGRVVYGARMLPREILFLQGVAAYARRAAHWSDWGQWVRRCSARTRDPSRCQPVA